MTTAEAKATMRVQEQSLPALIALWELSDIQIRSAAKANNTAQYQYIATVRGWLQDELEKRDPQAFDAWLESTEDSPERFYVA